MAHPKLEKMGKNQHRYDIIGNVVLYHVIGTPCLMHRWSLSALHPRTYPISTHSTKILSKKKLRQVMVWRMCKGVSEPSLGHKELFSSASGI